MTQKLKKILIADDDEAIVDATTILLETMGYEVIQTLNGAEVESLLSQQPDLIILDIWMSGINGMDVCHRIKNNPLYAHIPVLMISASRSIHEASNSSGADGYLAKPYDINQLVSKIEKLTI